MVPAPALVRGAIEAARIEGVTVAPERLLRIQGYRSAERVRPRVRRIAEAQAARAQALMAPEAVLRRVAIVAIDESGLTLAEGERFHGRDFARAFAGAREAIAFVLTLGPALDDEAARLTAAEDLLAALFLDSAGWLAMEQATRALARALAKRVAEEGLALSRRLAPGYGDWPLAEQHAFFRLFEGATLPVRLTGGAAMLPTKSRSGLYALVPTERRHRAPPAHTPDERPGA